MNLNRLLSKTNKHDEKLNLIIVSRQCALYQFLTTPPFHAYQRTSIQTF